MTPHFILRHIARLAPKIRLLRTAHNSDTIRHVLHIPVVYQYVSNPLGLVEVEIKKDATTNGWLFDTTYKLLVLDNGNDNEVRVLNIDDIREGCKTQLQKKKYLPADAPPAAGFMKVVGKASGRVIGWVVI